MLFFGTVDVIEALSKAVQIIEDETVTPTLNYHYVGRDWPSNMLYQRQQMEQMGYGPSIAAIYGLNAERQQRPRQVYEDPTLYRFSSTNFDLLIRIFGQLQNDDRPQFMSQLLEAVRKPKATQRVTPLIFPNFNGQRSYLGLLAEFSIRTGHLTELLEATKVPEMPSAGLAIMLTQIEEMIALNFNLFSDKELKTIPEALSKLREVARRQTYAASGIRLGGRPAPNPYFRQGYENVGRGIVAAVDGITEECRKARYFYLKGALQDLPNLEIESDKQKVAEFLEKLGFSTAMIGALNAAESDYRSTATVFELKNCLGHLRSFLEHLHRESVKSISAAEGVTAIDRWGDATLYLRQKEYISLPQEKFVTSLYTLISDESVHPLGTEREYARLLRNVVIEYGVMFLSSLDRENIRI